MLRLSNRKKRKKETGLQIQFCIEPKPSKILFDYMTQTNGNTEEGSRFLNCGSKTRTSSEQYEEQPFPEPEIPQSLRLKLLNLF